MKRGVKRVSEWFYDALIPILLILYAYGAVDYENGKVVIRPGELPIEIITPSQDDESNSNIVSGSEL